MLSCGYNCHASALHSIGQLNNDLYQKHLLLYGQPERKCWLTWKAPPLKYNSCTKDKSALLDRIHNGQGQIQTHPK